VLICRKLYSDWLKEDGFIDPTLLSNYEAKDYHKIYVGEIIACIGEQGEG